MFRRTTLPLAAAGLAVALGGLLAPTPATAAETPAPASTRASASATVLPFETFTDAPLPAAAAQVTRKLILSNTSYRSYFGHDAPAAVDWTRESVFFYSAGTKQTTGYRAGVSRVLRNTDGSLAFSTTLVSPGSGCIISPTQNVPHVLITFPRSATTPPSWTYNHTNSTNSCASGVQLTSSFSSTAQGWTAGFADYSPASSDMQLSAGIAPLPAGTAAGDGFRVSGMNRSDDLFMYLKRRLDTTNGVVAGQRYSARTTVTFWTNSSADCIGTGGNPGSSVYLKAGASTVEPTAALDSLNTYRMNISIGDQSQSGTNANVIGDVDNGLPCEDGRWVKVTRTQTTPVQVQADANGVLWLITGTDSGFEGLTTLYYTDISATLTAI